MKVWSAEIKELQNLHESLKGQVPDLEKELDRLVKAEDDIVILLCSRRCLEVIITDLCERELKRPRKTEPLKGVIDKLNKEEKIPSHIITSMQNLNSLSTYGAHPKEFSPRQVRTVLIELLTITEWYIKYRNIELDGTAEEKEEKHDIFIEEKYESKIPGDLKEHIPARKPKKKLIMMLSGFFLGVVIVVVALVVFNVISGRKQSEVDTNLEKSIAVLPFKNFSADPDQQFMCLGLTDEIINHLYKIESFDKVVSLTSVLLYKDHEKQITKIAEELKVSYILEGTYKKIGDQVRVTAQLIEPKNDKHIWQNEYDQPYKEIITIQADIALQIANHVKAFLTVSETQNIQSIPTTNQEAYELSQQINYLFYTQGFSALTQILDLLYKAIELDPNYADTYAWAGAFTLWKGNYAGEREMQSVAWDALPFFEKALEIDQNNAVAHYGMAQINDWIKWDYIKAEKEFNKAIELEPNNLILYPALVEFFLKMHRLEDALLYIKKSQETDITNNFLSMIQSHILSGNKKEAYNSISLASSVERVHPFVGENYIWLEEYDSAKLYLESAIQSKAPEILIPRFQACLALAYYKTKNYQQAQTIIKQLKDLSDETSAGSPAYFTGWYYSGIGEADSAFYWLEKAYENRSPEMPWLKVDPVFNNLKEDDRYWNLYERTGHKAYDEYMARMKK
ncbi:MAG: hypothetical protein KAX05_08320 [Bacteroidales bacterium]|nr:hypothetical protein [Bacteroidales bacterium]